MRVILVRGTARYEGKQYAVGDELDITEHFYNAHLNKFEKAAIKKSAAQVITNDEPPKEKSKKKENVEDSGTSPTKAAAKKAAAKSKSVK